MLYDAATLAGSSGSPVVSFEWDKMYALHHHGTEPEHPKDNRGVLVCRILELLQQKVVAPLPQRVLRPRALKNDAHSMALYKLRADHHVLIPPSVQNQLKVCYRCLPAGVGDEFVYWFGLAGLQVVSGQFELVAAWSYAGGSRSAQCSR